MVVVRVATARSRDSTTTAEAVCAFEQRFLDRVLNWVAAANVGAVDSISLVPHGPRPGKALAIGWWQDSQTGTTQFPSVWDEPGAVQLMDRHCWEITIRLLGVLGERLNEIHETDRPSVYWRMLLAPWMLLAVSTILDHRLACIAAHTLAPEASFLVSAPSAPPHTAKTWLTGLGTPHDRHSFLSRVVEAMELPTATVDCGLDCRPAVDSSPSPPGGRLASILSRTLRQPSGTTLRTLQLRGACLLFGGRRKRRLQLIDCNLFPRQALALYLQVRGCRTGSRVEVLHGYRHLPEPAPDPHLRAGLLALPVCTDAESLIVKTLPGLLPMSVMETYKHTVNESWRLFGGPSDVVHGNYRYEEIQNEFVARCLVAGRRVMFAQHGGAYGQMKVHGWSRLERWPETEFLSWGWTGLGVTPLPSARLSRLRDRHKGGNSVVLVEGYSPERCVALSYGSVNVGRLHGAAQSVEDFRDALSDRAIRAHVRVKHYPTLPEHGPTATDLMRSARIVVISYFDTAFIEALAINVPMIAFWDPMLYDVRDETLNALSELGRVGVLYSEHQSAARALENVYRYANQWWRQADIQDARLRFLDQYGQSSDWAHRWTSYLRGIGTRDSRTPEAIGLDIA
jgi:putative transferase (TIGR04331 family)